MPRRIFEIHREIAIDRPPEALFAKVTDFDRFGMLAARSDRVTITRLKGNGPPTAGHVWRIKGRALGRERQGRVRITRMDHPHAIGFAGKGGGFEAETEVRVMTDGPGSRFSVTTVLSASGFKARLAAPYLKLRRSRIEGAMEKGLKRLKDWVESAD
ncbi:MAG: SRPBCC family protein [Pseudomonadota bacterium]